MKNMYDIGFWLDLGDRAAGQAGNAFRWVFATKKRLQLVLLVLVVLTTAWGCSRLEVAGNNNGNHTGTATAVSTEKACFRPAGDTPAEKAAAAVSVQVCTSPDSPQARRASTKRLLTITDKDGVETAPAAGPIEHFAFGVPNQVQQVGGVDENGDSTVLATSSESRFLMTFNEESKLVRLQDITETSDATQAATDEAKATATPTVPASEVASPSTTKP